MARVTPKPHVVCIPHPLQGHIIPMLKLAKLLHHKGFHVTFVNTEANHNRILESRGPNALDGLPDFRFETIPLEIPNSKNNITLNMRDLREATRSNFLTPFRDLVINRLNNNNPPVTCILSDYMLTYSLNVSEELGIPNVLLCSTGVSGFIDFKDSRELIKKCIMLLQDPSNNMDSEEWDTPIEWIPGMKGAKLRDLPKIMQGSNRNESMKDTSEGDLERAARASAIIFHTFEALESQCLNEVTGLFRRVFSIGPLQLLLNQIPNEYYASVECSLWSKETECVKWLESKEPGSVVFINFGSTTVITVEQLVELAWGLANSNHNFLWITRPDMIMGESAVLPEEFLIKTKDRGFVASWCSQEDVLNHPSIGGFMTHCGWNSIVETICSGVPMICWPFFGEQFVSCRKSCNEWGIGIELSADFKRDEVAKLVDEILVGEKGKKLKNRALEWKKIAEEAIGSGGSSTLNLDILVNEVLLAKN